MSQEYSNKDTVSKEYMIPRVTMVNGFIESYLNYVWFEYDLVLSRKQLDHGMLLMVNDITPKLLTLNSSKIEDK
jgi:hypothetical protein